MIGPAWFIGFAFLFAIFTILSTIVEGAPVATGMTHLEILMNPLSCAPWTYLLNVWDMFWFRYAFLDEMPYTLARYLIFWPVSVGLVISLVISSFMGIVGLLRLR